MLGNIDSVSVPDAHTVVFWFKRRTPQQFHEGREPFFRDHMVEKGREVGRACLATLDARALVTA